MIVTEFSIIFVGRTGREVGVVRTTNGHRDRAIENTRIDQIYEIDDETKDRKIAICVKRKERKNIVKRLFPFSNLKFDLFCAFLPYLLPIYFCHTC